MRTPVVGRVAQLVHAMAQIADDHNIIKKIPVSEGEPLRFIPIKYS